MAAQIWGGKDCALSHRTAGALWELPAMPRGLPEVTTPRCLRPGPVLVYRKKLSHLDVRIRDGFRVTSIPRTLLDLAAVCPAPSVEGALADALYRRLTSVSQLEHQLKRSGGRGVRGSTLFRGLIDDAARQHPRAESILERRLWQILLRSNLPRPVAQYEIRDADRLVARVDFAYPDIEIAIEADGFRFHRGRRAWQRDLARRTALARLGWRVFHYVWEDVENNPDRVVDELRQALAAP